MKKRSTRRTALVTAAVSTVAALVAWSRRGAFTASGRLGFPRRTTPGNRYRRYELGSRPLLLREDLFGSGILTNVRRRKERS